MCYIKVCSVYPGGVRRVYQTALGMGRAVTSVVLVAVLGGLAAAASGGCGCGGGVGWYVCVWFCLYMCVCVCICIYICMYMCSMCVCASFKTCYRNRPSRPFSAELPYSSAKLFKYDIIGQGKLSIDLFIKFR